MGTGQFGDSQAPQAGEVSAEQQAEQNFTPAERSAHNELLKENVAAPDDEIYAYEAADEHPKRRSRLKEGRHNKVAAAAGSTSGIVPLVNRTGDIWAVFTAGILVTEDPLVVTWCEVRPHMCRRSDDHMTRSWATMKALASHRANRERLVPTDEIDADIAFPASGLTSGLAAEAAKEGSAGAEQVRNAEISKQSLIDTRKGQ